MSKDVLGGFEHRVLLTALHLNPRAFSAAIVGELEEKTGRSVALAAVHIALKRLERRGLVKSETRSESDEGGTRERRYFDVTRGGLRLLREERRELMTLWRGLQHQMNTR